jgi:DNA ligase-1
MIRKDLVQLAHPYKDAIDPTGWWASEKLDGVRATWDPLRRKLLSRYGNTFEAPAWFTEKLPLGLPLDGELWLRRGVGALPEAVSIVKSGSRDKGWNRIKYMLIDVPDSRVGLFEARHDRLVDATRRMRAAHVEVIPQTLCRGRAHLDAMMTALLRERGEGVMLRRALSVHEKGRSHDLLKVVRFYTAEAVVVDYSPGEGRHEGRVGALMCRLSNGVTFDIGTGLTDRQRDKPPRRGSKITFKYKSKTADGRPYAASYVTTRDYE